MKTITEYEVLSFLQEVLPPEELQAMALNYTICRENAPKIRKQYATLWSEATASHQDLENALQMFSGECSGPH
jgi:hypothetical protein